MGSRAFAEHPIVPLENIAAYLNYDVVGSNLLPSLKNITFAMAAESGGMLLQEALERSSGGSNLTLLALSEAFGQGRSDHKNFIDAGVTPASMNPRPIILYCNIISILGIGIGIGAPLLV